jgi:hypothetical protein
MPQFEAKRLEEECEMLVQNACELNMQDHGVNVAGAVKGCSLILWIGVKIF